MFYWGTSMPTCAKTVIPALDAIKKDCRSVSEKFCKIILSLKRRKQFSVEHEAAAMRVSTSKSESMILYWKKRWFALFRLVESSCPKINRLNDVFSCGYKLWVMRKEKIQSRID